MISAIANGVFTPFADLITDFDIGNYGRTIDKSIIICYTIIEVITMSELFDTAIVEKRNILNSVRSNSMTLQELRFFSIYLSKINPWDQSTRVVRFPLDDFRRIMGLGAGENITHFRYTIRHILQQIVEVPNEKGTGYSAFQLFKRAKVEKDEQDEWYVEFDAHDDALPLMFDFKNRYFKYELWNALRLKSPNQVRMYEILKQYESLGKRELTVSDLRELIGIGKNEYSGRTGWSDFKNKVLDSCQQALKETTDICYTYERGRGGKGGKWLTIIFHIKKNEDYVDQLSLDEFIAQQPNPNPLELDTMGKNGELVEQTTFFDDDVESEDDTPIEVNYGGELADLLGTAACDDEFTPEQIRVLQDLVLKAVPVHDNNARCDYLIHQVHKMNAYKPNREKRFSYLCHMIQNDIDGTR